MKITLLSLLIFIAHTAIGQHAFTIFVKDQSTNQPLPGATVQRKGLSIGSSADKTGKTELQNIPGGSQAFLVRFVGYQTKEIRFVFPLADTTATIIFLVPEEKELEEVIISTTRSSRNIDNIPTRVEIISSGELEEKASMQPSNVRMLLTESTGIQTQQTSATSANASIRIHGLDGKYTQLLQNGFPLYSGFSGGLSILQIPPLDLKRVEIIKGSSSTLYGGGAIAGLINFVTKEPTENRELSFLINANQSRALDASGFYAQKFGKTGLTVFASRNGQQAYDVNNDQLSDIPEFQRYTFNPRFFYDVNPAIKISFGINTNFENRMGGDMIVIHDKADAVHTYFEKNHTNRVSSQLKAELSTAEHRNVFFKNSVSFFDRKITKPGYAFSGRQVASFTELSMVQSRAKSEWVYGGNIWTEKFDQYDQELYQLDDQYWIGGAFIQNTTSISEQLIFESGLRIDYTSRHKTFVLPRISAMYKFTTKLTGRISGGLGYKMPSVFTESAEERAFQHIEPMSNNAKAEESYGGNMDVNYKTTIGDDWVFSVNQLFFYTKLNKPLVLQEVALPNGNFPFINADGFLNSLGAETNVKTEFKNFSLYLGYTFIDANTHYSGEKKINPLTARNRIYSSLMYEVEGKLRIAYELFYTGTQVLSSGEHTPSYWVMGISAERKWEHFSLFINAENFTDTRQSRFESMYSGTIQNPTFRQIWSSTEGFIYNGGIKLIF